MRIESTGRPYVSPEELKKREEDIMRANIRHDAIYGPNYNRFGWRSGFEPAAPKMDRESIWLHHRELEERIKVDGMLSRA